MIFQCFNTCMWFFSILSSYTLKYFKILCWNDTFLTKYECIFERWKFSMCKRRGTIKLNLPYIYIKVIKVFWFGASHVFIFISWTIRMQDETETEIDFMDTRLAVSFFLKQKIYFFWSARVYINMYFYRRQRTFSYGTKCRR